MIRPATKADLPALALIGQKFIEEAKLPFKLIPEIWVKNWSTYMDMGFAVVLLSQEGDEITGAIGGHKVPDSNNNEPVLAEAFWYVDPAKRGQGLKLLLSFIDLAKRQGCARISMVHLTGINAESLSKLYIRLGFSPIEVVYIMNLWQQ